MNLILLGMPGSGKGTQGAKIKEIYGIAHISTGDIFREAMKEGTPLGLKAKSYVDRGELVPDEVVTGMVKERLEVGDCKSGFILDGFPRTTEQAKALDEIMKENDEKINAVLNFEIPEALAIKRLSSRRTCRGCKAVYNILSSPPEKNGVCDKCNIELYQREDDTEDVIKNRLNVYQKQTEPLIEYYNKMGNLYNVDADDSIENIMEKVKKILK